MSLVSIIMPTFNRKHFLAEAFASIEKQHYSNWELIVVDDGSTDGSYEYLLALKEQVSNKVTVIVQENAGPAEARNRGIKEASGEFIAFFDSDDYWHEDHLSTAIETFNKYPSLSWVYFPCRRVDKDSGKVLLPSTFYSNSGKNKLFQCASELEPNVFKLNNQQATLVQLIDGIDSGFQNSVFRHKVFQSILIPSFRIGEDRLFILKALKLDIDVAFVDKITVTYHVHDSNSSDTKADSTDYEKRIKAMEELIASYEATFSAVNLNESEKAALEKRISEDYFWKLGYSLLWQNGYQKRAIEAYKQGFKYQKFNLKFWKTYTIALITYYLSLGKHAKN